MPTVDTELEKQLITIHDKISEHFDLTVIGSVVPGKHESVHFAIYKDHKTDVREDRSFALHSVESVDKLITFLQFIKQTWREEGWIE